MHSPLFRVLAFEIIGFVGLIAFSWLNEGLDVPHELFGGPESTGRVRVEEALSESLLILIVGAVVVQATYFSMRRIAYLESFIVMCSWCRRVKLDEEEWGSIEKFFDKHQTRTSHGLCHDCDQKMIEEDNALARR